MTDKQHTTWASTAMRYLDALEAGDVDALAALWQQAETDPQLEQMLGELTDGLADEEGPSPAWEADAERLRSLIREHLPSAFPVESELHPLTVCDVAVRLKEHSVLWPRLSAADKDANRSLLKLDSTLVPDDLSLPHFEKWKTSLGISASSRYWRTFRQAAVLLMMGHSQQAGVLAAARRAGPSSKGGRS